MAGQDRLCRGDLGAPGPHAGSARPAASHGALGDKHLLVEGELWTLIVSWLAQALGQAVEMRVLARDEPAGEAPGRAHEAAQQVAAEILRAGP